MNRPHPMCRLTSVRGFTVIEVLVALAIMGLLASFAVPKYEHYIDQARNARCIAEIRYLDRDIQAYIIANEKYPATLADLNLTIKNMLDPWGNPYQYVLLAGKTLVMNDEGDGPYYAGGGWILDVAPVYVDGAQGFWNGSWFASEAWAAPMPQLTAAPHTNGQRSRNLAQWSRHKGFIWSGPAVLKAPRQVKAGSGASSAAGGGSAVPTAGPTPPPPPSGGGGAPTGGGGAPTGGGGPPAGVGGGPPVMPRKDRFLVPINADYDLYSKGKDGLSVAPLTAAQSRDDIVRAANGAFVGLAENF